MLPLIPLRPKLSAYLKEEASLTDQGETGLNQLESSVSVSCRRRVCAVWSCSEHAALTRDVLLQMNTTRPCFPEMRCAEPWSSLVLCQLWPRRAARRTSSPGDRRLVLGRPPEPRIVGSCGDWGPPSGLAPLVLCALAFTDVQGRQRERRALGPDDNPHGPLRLYSTTPPHQELLSQMLEGWSFANEYYV